MLTRKSKTVSCHNYLPPMSLRKWKKVIKFFWTTSPIIIKLNCNTCTIMNISFNLKVSYHALEGKIWYHQSLNKKSILKTMLVQFWLLQIASFKEEEISGCWKILAEVTWSNPWLWSSLLWMKYNGKTFYSRESSHFCVWEKLYRPTSCLCGLFWKFLVRSPPFLGHNKRINIFRCGILQAFYINIHRH